MSYIAQSLSNNEAVHYTARYPTIRYVLGWSSLGAALLLAALALGHDAPVWAAIVTFCGAAALISILYQVWTSEIAVTNQRLIYKRGFFRRATTELQLRAIEEVRLRQDFWGRIFNYGNVEFRGTGLDDLSLPALADPVAVQKAVQESIGSHGHASELPGSMTMPESGVDPS